MASKKIFTSLAFQSGANLIAPKVEAITPEANLTTPTNNNSYYTGSAGQLAYNNGNIWVNNDSIWTKLLNHKTSATISGGFTFDRVDGNDAGIAPFIIGSSSSNVLVAGLNAAQLNGRVWDEDKTADTIVGRDGQGRVLRPLPRALALGDGLPGQRHGRRGGARQGRRRARRAQPHDGGVAGRVRRRARLRPDQGISAQALHGDWLGLLLL